MLGLPAGAGLTTLLHDLPGLVRQLPGPVQLGLGGGIFRFAGGIGMVHRTADPAGYPLGKLQGQNPCLFRQESGVEPEILALGLLRLPGGSQVICLSPFQLSGGILQLRQPGLQLAQQSSPALGFGSPRQQLLPTGRGMGQELQLLLSPVPLLPQPVR